MTNGAKIRVGVVGATGKMGRVVCSSVLDDQSLSLVAAIGRTRSGEPFDAFVGRRTGLVVQDRMEALLEVQADVAVDFTHPDALMPNARWYSGRGLNAVIGTTGMREGDLDELRRLATSAHLIVAPDFSYAGTVMLHIARIAARFLPEIELLEVHAPTKAESPSGTTMNTARELARVRAASEPSRSREIVAGARGGELAGIRVHSMRMNGAAGGSEEIRFSAPGESLTIVQTAHDRAAYARGVLHAIKQIKSRPGLTYGFEQLLDLGRDQR
jgi:4-hydroxy-tetrahydrodipicolinate reductase